MLYAAAVLYLSLTTAWPSSLAQAVATSADLQTHDKSLVVEARWAALGKSAAQKGYVETEETSQEWDSLRSEWAPAQRRTVSRYDGDCRLAAVTQESREAATGAWKNGAFRSLYTYNSSGSLDLELMQKSTNGKPWEDDTRFENTYSGSGLPLQNTTSRWDPNAKKWVPTSRSHFALDERGRVERIENQSWHQASSAWVNDSRIVLIPPQPATGPDRADTVLFEDFDTSSGKWVNSGRQTSTYSSKGTQTSTRFQEWDDETAGWRNWKGIAYELDSADRIRLSCELLGLPTSVDWIEGNCTRFSYEYDSAARLAREVSELKGEDTVIKTDAVEYSYDDHGNMTEEKKMERRGDQWRNVRRTQYSYQSCSSPVVRPVVERGSGVASAITVHRDVGGILIRVAATPTPNALLKIYTISGRLLATIKARGRSR